MKITKENGIKTYEIEESDCIDRGWYFEIQGCTYAGNLKIHLNRLIVVKGDQTVKGNQIVEGNLVVEGNQIVEGYQFIKGYQVIEGNQVVGGTQEVEGNQTIKGNQTMKGNQIIKGNQLVLGDQTVNNDQTVKGYQTLEGEQNVRYKSISSLCCHPIKYSATTIKIGCQEKTTEEWLEWFASDEVFHIPRNRNTFKDIEKAFHIAVAAQKYDRGLMR
jgi:uncharacterized Zn-binding protein involved in type VI secretion